MAPQEEIIKIIQSIGPVFTGIFSFMGSKKARTIDTLLNDIRTYEKLIELEQVIINDLDRLTTNANKNMPKLQASEPIKDMLKQEYGTTASFSTQLKESIVRYEKRIKQKKELIETISKADYK